MCRRLTYVVVAWAIGLAAVPASADLIGWWKMEQGSGTDVWDYIAPYEDATIAPWNEEVVRWTTEGYKGNALEFLSATDLTTFVDAPLEGAELDTREASYSFWMNMPNAFQAWGPIFVLLGGVMDHSIECDGAADLYVNAQGGSVWFGTKGAALNDEQWHHVAVTYSTSANRIAIYVDGKVAATTASSLSDSILAVRIGGPRNRNQWRRYIGKLDEVAVWSNALSADDVKNVFWIGPAWERYATNPDPANEAILGATNVILKWTAGTTAAQHHLYVGESLDDVKNGAAGTDKGTTTATTFEAYPWELGKTYYWRVDEVEADGTTVYTGTVWSFTISAKRASTPAPASGAILVDPNVTLSWVAGSGAVSRDVYLGTDSANLPRVSKAQTATTYTPSPLAYDTTYYWRVDEFDGASTATGEVWHFKTTPNIQVTDPNLVGWWNFDRDEVGIALDWSGHGNHGILRGDPNRVTGYNLGAVAFDGINDMVEVPQVIVNDLTLMAWIKAGVAGPDGTTAREGSGLLWSDQAGGGDHFTVAVLGKKLAFETGGGGGMSNTTSRQDVVTGDWIHVAVTRTESTRECDIFVDGGLDTSSVHVDNRVGANPRIEIGGNPLDSRYFKGIIDEVKAYNRVLSQEELVQAMRANLLLAWNPKPFNGEAVDIRNTLQLKWSAGDGAAKHDVYFGTDPKTGGFLRGRLTVTTYSPPDKLQWAKTCYWRVDEVSATGTVTKGRVWSFSVADYLIVDDFETYDDVCNRIFFAWMDGLGYSASTDCTLPASNGNGTGSTVGNVSAPFAERTIVHSGRQSMPFGFDNTKSPFYSEAVRDWSAAQTWTAGGVNTLRLYLRGDAASFVETSPGAILMNGTGTDIWGAVDELRFVYKSLSGNGSITAKVESLTNTHTNAKAGVMIREALAPESVHGLTDVTPGAGVEFIRRLEAAGDSTSTVQTGLSSPYWVRITRTGSTFTSQCSADGVTWTSVGTDAAASSATISMANNVFIGLAVTSHAANVVCAAKFSNVATTGAVSGPWQTADIGVTQISGNQPEAFYVAVQDSTGNVGVVSHTDPAVIATGTWQEWSIPLSQFTSAGVNLTSVKKVMLGVGDRNAPKAGGAGKLYLDEIRVIKNP